MQIQATQARAGALSGGFLGNILESGSYNADYGSYMSYPLPTSSGSPESQMHQDVSVPKEPSKITFRRDAVSIEMLLQGMEKRLENSIDNVGKRLDDHIQNTNNRFDSMDKRFDSMDKRFDSMDKKFDGLSKDVGEVKDRLGRVEVALEGKSNKEVVARIEATLEGMASKEDVAKAKTWVLVWTTATILGCVGALGAYMNSLFTAYLR